MLLNTTPAIGRRVQVRLIGRTSNRDGIGCSAAIVVDGTSFINVSYGGGSYLSASSPLMNLTHPVANPVNVTLDVQWPSGHQQKIRLDQNLPRADLQAITVVEPILK